MRRFILLPLSLMLLLLVACTPTLDATGNAALLEQGRTVYEQECARCHGMSGEGQPDWQTTNADGSRPAPPHDSTGHTWHHADAQLLMTIDQGRGAMPAFGATLTTAEQEAVLLYLKTFWGPREQEAQAEVTRQWQAQYQP